LYFMTGGRRLESDLYRVSFKGELTESQKVLVADEGQQAREIRRQLESYHGKAREGAVEFAWPYLKHKDRFIRYAARLVLEHQPVSKWASKALQEEDPIIRIQAIVALARQPKGASGAAMLKALSRTNFSSLNEAQQIDLLRAVELVILRAGKPAGASRDQLVAYLNPHYPAKSNAVN